MLVSIVIVFVGFAVLIIVIGRKLPVLGEKVYEMPTEEGSVVKSATGAGILQKGAAFLPQVNHLQHFSLRQLKTGDTVKRISEKLIRRAHIGLLKLDNRLLKWLELCSPRSSSQIISVSPKKHISFKKLIALPRVKNQQASNQSAPASAYGHLSKRSNLKNVQDKVGFGVCADVKTTTPHEEFWLGILRQNPKNPHPYKRLGEIYMQQGLYDEAEAVFSYALKHNTKDQEILGWVKSIKAKRARKSA